MKKTFKREFAVLMVIWLIYLVETKDVNIVETLVWPIFTFVTAAFGLDQYSKLQQKSSEPSGRGRDSRSSKHSGGEDKYPNLGEDK